MRRETGKALAILLVLVTTVAAVEGLLLIRLGRRVSTIEDRSTESSPGRLELTALGEVLQEIHERQEIQQHAQRSAQGKLDEAVRRVEALESAVAMAPGARDGNGTAVSPDQIRTAIENAVARKIEEKIQQMPRGGDGEWKPSLEELKEALELDERQTRDAERIIDEAKHEVFELASLRRDDGSSFLDDLVAAIKDPADPEAAAKRVFMSLFTKKIPGRDEPYIAEIIRIKSRAEKSLTGILDEEQSRKLVRSNVDYLGVKTAYDPFAEYVQESLK